MGDRRVLISAMLTDPVKGGLWLGFLDGGIAYFNNGKLAASLGRKDGLGADVVWNLLLDRDGALWAATDGGISRIKDGRVATLSTKNGLPCEVVRLVSEDESSSLWLYTPCGLVRIAHAELDAWWSNSKRTVHTLLAMLWTIYKVRVRALERRQALLEQHQTEIRALNEQMIETQEAERTRIAGDLHDGVLQQITSLVLRLGVVKRQVPPDSEAKATVNSVQQQLIQIGTDVRQISHELHPALLQEAGLPAALSSYCEEFSKVRSLPVECETDESVEQLSPGAALCLYRIAQEALGNAAKYSAAKKVEVRLTRSDSRVSLSVSDDGVGCAPDQIAKSGGLGVINMRERVLQLKGTFDFDSEPGRGTRVTVTVPLRPAS